MTWQLNRLVRTFVPALMLIIFSSGDDLDWLSC
jgi:hypothetical protein